MNDKLNTLKYLVGELEQSFNLSDKNKINMQINKVREVLNEIEREALTMPTFQKIQDSGDNLENNESREENRGTGRESSEINGEDNKIYKTNKVSVEPNKVVKYPHKKINSIPFIIKPTEIYGVTDIYDGNFLERFCDSRTQDLMNALCINQHNAFWNQHQTINGNVYASVPKELLKDDSIESLKKLKWKTVDVDIYDFGKKTEDEAVIIQACQSKFKKFILVLEKSTDAYLALVFP